jgi:hypothetical protein
VKKPIRGLVTNKEDVLRAEVQKLSMHEIDPETASHSPPNISYAMLLIGGLGIGLKGGGVRGMT